MREPVSECRNSVPHHTEELEGNERDVKEEEEELEGWKSGQHRLAAHLLRMGLTFDSGRRRFGIAFGRIGRKHAVYLRTIVKLHAIQAKRHAFKTTFSAEVQNIERNFLTLPANKSAAILNRSFLALTNPSENIIIFNLFPNICTREQTTIQKTLM